MVNVAIGGLGSYLISEGVKIKEHRLAFSAMYAEVTDFIERKKWIVVSFALPLIIWLFSNNNLALHRLIIFTILIILDVFLRVRLQIYQCVFNTLEKYNKLQIVALSGSLARIIFVFSFTSFFTAEVAYSSLILSYAIQLFVTLYMSKSYIIHDRKKTEREFPTSLKRLYNSQIPITLYNYFDAQIGIFIVTYFGNIALLADINAAAKLNLIVVAVNAFINNFIIVQFAKIKERMKFVKLLLFTISVFLIIYMLAVVSVVAFPRPFILLIGSKYENIAPFLYLTVISICIFNFSGLIYSINYSKMWIKRNWIAIPITVFLQILLLKFMPPDDFSHVAYYAMISGTPTLTLNLFYCIRGISSIKKREE